MNQENQSKARLKTGIVPFLMCTNTQPLRCHPDELKIELGNYGNNPAILTLTETWLIEKDVLEDGYNLEKHQPGESKRGTSGQDQVLLFMCEKVVKRKLLGSRVKLNVRNFCVIYGPYSQKIPKFLQVSENSLQFYGVSKKLLFCAVTLTLIELRTQRRTLNMRNYF